MLIFQEYADWEGAYITSAVNLLGQRVYEIKTVSLSKDSVKSIGGFRMLPDYDLSSVPEEYEALILIGGMSWRKGDTKQLMALVEDCVQKGKVLGGICDAVAFLAVAGALNKGPPLRALPASG